jgi:hypothetical protein
MGRFSAIVLLLAAACGDNLSQPGSGHPPPGGTTPQPTGDGVPTAFYAPQVCGDLSWTINSRNTAIDISVVPRASGAQVLSVPLAGGSLTGYSLTKAMDMQTVGAQLSISDTFTTVSASEVNGQLTSTALDASSIRVHVIADDLSSAQQVAKLLPGYISNPAFQTADGVSFVPVADDQGLRIERFNGAWTNSTMRVATTEPATGLAAAQMDYSTVAAWSTKANCYMMSLFTPAPGPLVTMPEACTDPHLAIDSTSQHGQLVFQGPDGIRMLSTQHTSFDGISQLIGRDGTAPRVVWDGQRFWISYLDLRGDIVVGFLDGGDSGHYVSTGVFGPRPGASAYDLVMIAGQVWAVSFDASGYMAHRICVEPV